MCKGKGNIILRWLGMINLPVFVIVVIVCLIIVIGLEIIFNDCSIQDDSLVIAFFGILATFIVISQYAQVTEIKNDTTTKLADMQRNIDKHFVTQNSTIEQQIKEKTDEIEAKHKQYQENLNNDIKNFKEEINKEISDTDEYNSIASKINRLVDAAIDSDGNSKANAALMKCQNVDDMLRSISLNISQLIEPLITERVKDVTIQQNLLITYLLTGRHSNMLLELIRNKTYLCTSIKLRNNETKENVVVEWRNNELYTKNVDGITMVDILQVEEKDFDVEEIISLLGIFKMYYEDAERTNNLSVEERAVKIITENILRIYNSDKKQGK